MADRTVDILLVGGGIASATAAHTWREQGFEGSIVLVGREPHPPYHRPPASKEYLRGEHGPEGAHVHHADWWEANDVELLTRTSVLDLDTDRFQHAAPTRQSFGYAGINGQPAQIAAPSHPQSPKVTSQTPREHTPRLIDGDGCARVWTRYCA